MSKIDHSRPAFRRRGKTTESVRDGAAPSEMTPFAAQMVARRREARQKAELAAIAASFLAEKAKAGH